MSRPLLLSNGSGSLILDAFTPLFTLNSWNNLQINHLAEQQEGFTNNNYLKCKLPANHERVIALPSVLGSLAKPQQPPLTPVSCVRSTGTSRWQRRLFITFSRSPLSGFCTRWWHGGCTWAPERCLANWWVKCNYNIVAAGHSYSVMVNISTYSLCRVNRREPGDMWHEWWLPLSSVSIQLIYGNAIFNYVLRVVRRESLSWMEKNDQILW